MKKLFASLAITALVALPVSAQDLDRQAVVAALEVPVAHQVVQLAEQRVQAPVQQLELLLVALQQQLLQ